MHMLVDIKNAKLNNKLQRHFLKAELLKWASYDRPKESIMSQKMLLKPKSSLEQWRQHEVTNL